MNSYKNENFNEIGGRLSSEVFYKHNSTRVNRILYIYIYIYPHAHTQLVSISLLRDLIVEMYTYMYPR